MKNKQLSSKEIKKLKDEIEKHNEKDIIMIKIKEELKEICKNSGLSCINCIIGIYGENNKTNNIFSCYELLEQMKVEKLKEILK